MKRFLFPALAYLFLIFPPCASAQTNTVTLTSYYPAPFGAYDRLRLVPRASLGANCTGEEEGTLYIETPANIINQCTSGFWLPLSGGVIKMSTVAAGTDPENNLATIDQYIPVKAYANLAANAPYLGIGTSNPLRPLHVAVDNPGVPSTIVLENTRAVNGAGTSISFRGVKIEGPNVPFTEMASIKTTYRLSAASKQQSDMAMGVTDGLTGLQNEIFTIFGDQGGSVGILAPIPSSSFEINGKGVGKTYFQITANDATNLTSGDVFTVTGSGQVGINQKAPTEKLEVVGNIKATTLILTSDAGLKKDITPVQDSLDKISRLKGVSFEWKDNPSDQRKHMGVLAQDVERIFPEAVYGQDGSKGVDYPALIAPLIEAVKELKNKNEILTEQIYFQQQQIQSLQKSLEAKEPLLAP
ncbi:MAG: tail fiber domain-containing protein [Candidatus Omnitrophica bacterium]|nr:tail fiber domain-containing protein [Candidatus Omnitrophota bacterium]